MDVSVVIPTHGRPALVREAVLSVLGQSAPPAEVVVVVDGPDPRVDASLAGLPVRVLQEPAGGVAAARNAGVAAATSRWVAFLDDDNLWHPELLARVGALVADDPAVRAVDTGYWLFAETDEDARDQVVDLVARTLDECLERARHAVPVSSLDHLVVTGRSFELLLERMRGSMSTAVVERDLLVAAGGFPVGTICAEDWTMFTNVARFVEWHVLLDRLAFCRVHPRSNTTARALLNGPATLHAIRAMWQEDRLPWPVRPPISRYRREYGFTLRASLTDALFARRPDLYLDALRTGRHLVGPADLARAMVPSRAQWRTLRRRHAREARP